MPSPATTKARRATAALVVDAGGEQAVQRRRELPLQGAGAGDGVPAEERRGRPVGSAVDGARQLEAERGGRAGDQGHGPGEGLLQPGVRRVRIGGLQARTDRVHGALHHALVDREGDALRLGVASGVDHRDLAAGRLPGRVQRQRDVVDQRVHHVVGVEVGVEGEVRRVPGLHGGRSRAAAVSRSSPPRLVAVSVAARGHRGLDRGAQPLPHRVGPQPGVPDQAVGGVQRPGDRVGDALARRGQCGGGGRVAAGRAHGQCAGVGQLGEQAAGGGDLPATPSRSLLLKAMAWFCWARNCQVAYSAGAMSTSAMSTSLCARRRRSSTAIAGRRSSDGRERRTTPRSSAGAPVFLRLRWPAVTNPAARSAGSAETPSR